MPRTERTRAPDLSPQSWVAKARPTGLTCCLLFALAVAVRLPFFMDVPALSDELTDTTNVALRIWRGARPLTGEQAYLGPVFYYLVAGVYALFGPSVYAARATALVLGALTVPFTFLLVREVAGPRAGMLAGLILATAPTHIAVNSRIAFSHSASPLFVTAGLWAVVAALQRRRGALLVLAGAAFGLALDTHPTLLIPLVAVVGYFFWSMAARRQWGWLSTPWPYLGALGFCIGYGPLLWFNLTSDFGTFTDPIRGISTASPGRFPRDWPNYWSNLGSLLLELARMSSGVWRPLEDPAYYLFHAAILVYGALIVWGVALMVRRGYRPFTFTLFAAVVAMPLANKAYGLDADEPPFPEISRYVAFLLPITAAAIALSLLELRHILARTKQLLPHFPGTAVVGILWAAVLLYPLANLADFYREKLERGERSGGLLQLTAALKELRAQEAAPVVMGPSLKLQVGLLTAESQLWSFLTLEQVVDGNPRFRGEPELDLLPSVERALAGGRAPYLVLAPPEREALSRRYCLRAVGLPPDSVGIGSVSLGLYRPRPGPPCPEDSG